jgi:hypothetical protein
VRAHQLYWFFVFQLSMVTIATIMVSTCTFMLFSIHWLAYTGFMEFVLNLNFEKKQKVF